MHLKNFSMHVFHALLRKTILVDCAQNGLVSTSSYWLAQGFPHPAVDLVLASLQKCVPCDWLFMATQTLEDFGRGIVMKWSAGRDLHLFPPGNHVTSTPSSS